MKSTYKYFHLPAGIFAIAFIAILLFSCASNQKSAIAGNWTEIDGDQRIEFSFSKQLEVDWVVFIDGDTILQGRYTFVDKDRVELIFFSITAPGATGTLVESIRGEVSISGDELTLTMPDGDISRFRREK